MLMVLIQLFNLDRKPPSDGFSFLLKKRKELPFSVELSIPLPGEMQQ